MARIGNIHVPKFLIVRPPHVRHHHYRRCLMLVIIGMFIAHELIPVYEHWVALITNLAFFYDPVIAD